MPTLQIYLDDRSFAALERCSASLGRSIEDLAEAAVADAAVKGDPLPPVPTIMGLDLAKGPDLIGVRCSCGRDHAFSPAEIETAAWIACACGVDLLPVLHSKA